MIECPCCIGKGHLANGIRCDCCGGTGNVPSESPYVKKELKPFIEIARRKGAKITYSDNNIHPKLPHTMHLDMDMVEQTIRDAINSATKMQATRIIPKLQRLLDKGTDYQKVMFTFSSGKYFFPEDIERMAEEFRKSGTAHAKGIPSCHTVCRTVCECLGASQQTCRELCSEICSID